MSIAANHFTGCIIADTENCGNLYLSTKFLTIKLELIVLIRALLRSDCVMNCKKCVCNKCINNCRCQFCSGSIKECDHKNVFEQISMFPKKKLARFFTWDDYGISKDRYKELCTLCRSNEYASLARSAAHTANKDIEEYILLSVRENKSYEGVEYAEKLGRIPCGRTDFYGYRRLFFHNFDNALKMVQNQ